MFTFKKMTLILGLFISCIALNAAEVGCSQPEISDNFKGKSGIMGFMYKMMKLKDPDNSEYLSILCKGKTYYIKKSEMQEKKISTSLKFNIINPDGAVVDNLLLESNKDGDKDEFTKKLISLSNSGNEIELAENGFRIDNSISVYNDFEFKTGGVTLAEAIKNNSNKESFACIINDSSKWKIGSCQENVCILRLTCDQNGVRLNNVIATCLAKPDGSCPSGVECFNDKAATPVNEFSTIEPSNSPASTSTESASTSK